jgi:predicted RNA-binding protein YlxR (DUF448 family)
VRLVRVPSGAVTVDVDARATGRGAYVCPDTACLERGLARGRLTHAFRKPSAAGPDLAEAVRDTAARRAAGATPGRRRADMMAVRA